MGRIDDIKQQMSSLREEEYKIESELRQQQMKACVGKFFKYRNCYSCPESDADRWWMYAAVYMEGKEVTYMCFQTDKDGKFEFEKRPYFLSEGWWPITKKEFASELRKAKKRFEAFESKALG